MASKVPSKLILVIRRDPRATPQARPASSGWLPRAGGDTCPARPHSQTLGEARAVLRKRSRERGAVILGNWRRSSRE